MGRQGHARPRVQRPGVPSRGTRALALVEQVKKPLRNQAGPARNARVRGVKSATTPRLFLRRHIPGWLLSLGSRGLGGRGGSGASALVPPAAAPGPVLGSTAGPVEVVSPPQPAPRGRPINSTIRPVRNFARTCMNSPSGKRSHDKPLRALVHFIGRSGTFKIMPRHSGKSVGPHLGARQGGVPVGPRRAGGGCPPVGPL